jgi:hypothetical protein
MIIVNFSTKEYSRPQRRLINSLDGYPKLMFNDYTSIGSPSHQESPYEFKLFAIEAGWKYDDIVLWADSSLWRVGDLGKIEDLIIRDGYFMSEAGHYVSRWTNQFTKNYFRVNDEEMKEEAGGMIMFSAGLLGLNRKSEITQEFFSQWKEAAKAGCFKGDYSTHRHDQSSASIIAQRLGMKYQRGGEFMSYIGPGYSEPEKETVFYLQGMV